MSEKEEVLIKTQIHINTLLETSNTSSEERIRTSLLVESKYPPINNIHIDISESEKRDLYGEEFFIKLNSEEKKKMGYTTKV